MKKSCILIITSINKEIYKYYILEIWKKILNNDYGIDIYYLIDDNIDLISFMKYNGLLNYCIINNIKN